MVERVSSLPRVPFHASQFYNHSQRHELRRTGSNTTEHNTEGTDREGGHGNEGARRGEYLWETVRVRNKEQVTRVTRIAKENVQEGRGHIKRRQRRHVQSGRGERSQGRYAREWERHEGREAGRGGGGLCLVSFGVVVFFFVNNTFSM